MLPGKLPLQNILLRKTFKVSLLTEEQSQKMKLNKIALTSGGLFSSSHESFFCKSVREQISNKGEYQHNGLIIINVYYIGIQSLLDLTNLFDSIITQKLNSLGSINTLAYLCQVFIACQAEQEKQINKAPHNALFLKQSIEMVLNYAILFIQASHVFENHIPSIQNFSSEPQAIAAAIADLLNVSGFNSSFFKSLNTRFYQQSPELFVQVYKFLLISLTFRVNSLNFAQIDTHNEFLILCNLLQNQQIKPLIFTLNENGMAWLPKVNAVFGGNQTINGEILESSSPLGVYLSKSILPRNSAQPQKEFYELTENMYFQLTHQKSQVFLDKEIKKYQQNILNYSQSVFQLIKNLIKGPQKEAVFEWLGASIQGNLSRTKLGADLMTQSRFTAILNKVSSDGFMLNQLYILLKFCKPFLNQNDKKLQKIDPTYLKSGRRFNIKNETPLCTNQQQGQECKIVFQQNYGTISQFFFLALQSLHFGFIPIIQKFQQMIKQLNQLKKLKSQEPLDSQFLETKIDQQIKALQQKNLIYQVQLFEPSILKDISQIYYILSSLLLQWGEASDKTWAMKDPPCEILKVLPDHLFFDYSNFMEFMFAINNNQPIQSFQISHVIKHLLIPHYQLVERSFLIIHCFYEKPKRNYQSISTH